MAQKDEATAVAAEAPAKNSTLRYKLVSRLKYQVQIRLKGGENVFIPAHGTIQSIDPELLDTELPVGVHKVEFQA